MPERVFSLVTSFISTVHLPESGKEGLQALSSGAQKPTPFFWGEGSGADRRGG